MKTPTNHNSNICNKICNYILFKKNKNPEIPQKRLLELYNLTEELTKLICIIISKNYPQFQKHFFSFFNSNQISTQTHTIHTNTV